MPVLYGTLYNKKIEEMGYEVIYGDTDSAFVNSNAKSKKEADAIGKKIEKEINEFYKDQIKKEIGPIALPKEVYLVEDLPKTRSGKIMRRILKKLFTQEELGDLSTLANPESVEKIKKIILRAPI